MSYFQSNTHFSVSSKIGKLNLQYSDLWVFFYLKPVLRVQAGIPSCPGRKAVQHFITSAFHQFERFCISVFQHFSISTFHNFSIPAFLHFSNPAFQPFRIFKCFPIPRERLDHLNIPNAQALRQSTNKPTDQQLSEYRAYPDFFNRLLDWKE